VINLFSKKGKTVLKSKRMKLNIYIFLFIFNLFNIICLFYLENIFVKQEQLVNFFVVTCVNENSGFFK